MTKRTGKPTNIYLSHDVKAEGVQLAKERGQSLSDIIEWALRSKIAAQKRKESSVQSRRVAA